MAEAFNLLEAAMGDPQPIQGNSPHQMAHEMLKTHMAIVAFTAAPLIGRWDKFIEIGNSLPEQELEVRKSIVDVS